jgi:hypothetical protein
MLIQTRGHGSSIQRRASPLFTFRVNNDTDTGTRFVESTSVKYCKHRPPCLEHLPDAKRHPLELCRCVPAVLAAASATAAQGLVHNDAQKSGREFGQAEVGRNECV